MVKPRECPRLDSCYKVRMILDKDLMKRQYSELIEGVCARCTEVVRAPRQPSTCGKCGQCMILASSYDPDGLIPLHGGISGPEGVPILVCINPRCEDGKRNVLEVAHA